jgi:hypothetical protein
VLLDQPGVAAPLDPRAEALVNDAVAIVIDAVASLDRSGARGALSLCALDAVRGALAGADTATRDACTLVRDAVAVVVDAVAELCARGARGARRRSPCDADRRQHAAGAHAARALAERFI